MTATWVDTLKEYRQRVADYLEAFDRVIEVVSSVPLVNVASLVSDDAPPVPASANDAKPKRVARIASLRGQKPAANGKHRLTIREYAGRNERWLIEAVAAQPGEFRNKDLVDWLLKHRPEAGVHLERKTGAVSMFVSKLKERGWVEFVRKDGVSAYNRKTKAFRADPIEEHERFKRDVLGMTPTEEGGEE